MKSLTDAINESKTNLREIEKYAHNWITQSSTAEEYSAVLHALIDGAKDGCKENLKYLKDEKEQDALKVLEDVLTHLSLSIPYETKNASEWNDQWVSQHLN